MSHYCTQRTVKKRFRPSRRKGSPSSRVNNNYCPVVPSACLVSTSPHGPTISQKFHHHNPLSPTPSCPHAQKPAMKSRNLAQSPTAVLASPSAHYRRCVAPQGPSSSCSDDPCQNGHADPSCPSSRQRRPQSRLRSPSLRDPSHCAEPDTVAVERAQSGPGNAPLCTT